VQGPCRAEDFGPSLVRKRVIDQDNRGPFLPLPCAVQCLDGSFGRQLTPYPKVRAERALQFRLDPGQLTRIRIDRQSSGLSPHPHGHDLRLSVPAVPVSTWLFGALTALLLTPRHSDGHAEPDHGQPSDTANQRSLFGDRPNQSRARRGDYTHRLSETVR
jgi:hypothetical protein